MIVVQPRIEGSEWSEWSITIEKLLEYEIKLKEGVKQVYSENPPAKSGDHCKFCRAKANCPTILAKTEEVIQTSFDAVPVDSEPVLPTVEGLTTEQIAKVLNNSKLIEDWFKSVSQHAHDLLEKGEEIEGYKLVLRKTNRKVKDEGELVDAFGGTFGDQLYQKKLITLGKLEKLVGKKELSPFLFKPSAGSQIAPVSDKRAALKPAIEGAFEDVPIEDENNEYSDMEF